MACLATAEEEVGDRIEIALGAVGLKTVEIQDVTSVQGPEEADEFDDHLAQNMENLEQTKTVVWGTIHLYRADSDA